MRLRMWRLGCVGLLLTAGFSQSSAKGPEPRLVAEEFQETLERISTGTALKPPGALDFPPQTARFVRVAIHKTSGSSQPGIDELEIFAPAGSENLAAAKRGATPGPRPPVHKISSTSLTPRLP
jgi:hypothetical protein